MAIKLIRKCSSIALVLLAGCGSEVQVSVDGFGSVAAVEGDFNCWAGKPACEIQINKQITLVAKDPADGSAIFGEWSGMCTGSERECTLRNGGKVQAHFTAVRSAALNSAKPVIKTVKGLSPTRLSILWQAAKGSKRAEENLSYLVYVSTNRENLLHENNLVSTIAGNMFGDYAFQHEVAKETDLTLQSRVVHVAVAVRDEKGSLGEAAYQYDVHLLQPEPELRFDVVTQKAPAPPPEGDGEI